MSRTRKVLLVVAGYAVALIAAAIVTQAHVQATSGPDAQASSGMMAFGDAVLFLGAFCVAALPATCAALLLLRPVPQFWRASAGIALVLAATALAALGLYLTAAPPAGGPSQSILVALAPLRLLLAPVLACASLLAAVFVPSPRVRWAFIGAATLEALAFTTAAIALFQRS